MAEEQNAGQVGLASKVSAHVKEVVLAGVRDSPGPLRAFIVIAYLGAAFSAGLAAILALQGKAGWALCALGGVLASTALGLVVSMVWSLYVSSRGSGAWGAPRQPTWTRLVPKLPMSDDTTSDLLDRLNAVRNRALEAIQQDLGLTDVQLPQVRANIFLPDIAKLGTWGVCSLYIPEGLHVGIDSLAEQQIRFWPSQGLTGTVFTTQRPQPARFESATGAESRDWHGRYDLTDDQRERVHPDLKWIISFPLKVQDGDRQRTMGVLNVDGLQHELMDEQLRALMGSITYEIMKLTAVLNRHAKRRVAIVVEDEND